MASYRSFELRVVFLIVFITIVNYFDRSAISYAILPIEQELHLNNAQFGLVASGFGIGYLSVVFLTGYLIDRYDGIRIWAFCAMLWSLITIAMSLAQGFTSFFILRIALGIAEGVHYPALLKTIADWLHPAYRARSLSFALMGVPLGALIGAPFITEMIHLFSWRGMFVILGLLGFIWAFSWLFNFRGKKNPHLGIGEKTSLYIEDIPWKKLFLSSTFLSICLLNFVFGYIVFFALIWFPGYFQQTHHISIQETGWIVMVPWLASLILILIGGSISDFLSARTHSIRISRTYPIVIGMGLSSLFFFLLRFSPHLETDLFLLSAALAFAFFTNSPIYALNADLFPKQVGVAQAMASCFFALAAILAPSITGWLVQITGTFHSAFFLISSLSLVACFLAFFLQKEIAS